MSGAVTPRMYDALAALLRAGSAPLIELRYPWRWVWQADGWEIAPNTANALRRRLLAEVVPSGVRRVLRLTELGAQVARERAGRAA